MRRRLKKKDEKAAVLTLAALTMPASSTVVAPPPDGYAIESPGSIAGGPRSDVAGGLVLRSTAPSAVLPPSDVPPTGFFFETPGAIIAPKVLAPAGYDIESPSSFPGVSAAQSTVPSAALAPSQVEPSGFVLESRGAVIGGAAPPSTSPVDPTSPSAVGFALSLAVDHSVPQSSGTAHSQLPVAEDIAIPVLSAGLVLGSFDASVAAVLDSDSARPDTPVSVHGAGEGRVTPPLDAPTPYADAEGDTSGTLDLVSATEHSVAAAEHSGAAAAPVAEAAVAAPDASDTPFDGTPSTGEESAEMSPAELPGTPLPESSLAVQPPSRRAPAAAPFKRF